MLALLLAAAAAACNAAGDVLQRSSARHERSDPRQSVQLLGRLLRRPRWLLGLVASVVGLGLHIGALSVGELSIVQPLLVLELPLAVLGSALFLGQRLTARDLSAIAVLGVGLVLFVAFLGPSGGRRLGVPALTWVLGVTGVVVVVAALTVWGWHRADDTRGGLLSAAAGAGYGLTGVFFATAGAVLQDGGVGALVTSWPLWAAVVSGGASFYLLQNALAAGNLVAVDPGITLANPLVAVAWGLLVFEERARTGWALVGTVAGAALLVAGVVLLARSPALRSDDRDSAPARSGPDVAVTGHREVERAGSRQIGEGAPAPHRRRPPHRN